MAQQLSEVEQLVGELETRVERLRALYEMYFMGIEKIEPSVPRKDVDRRFYVLRRTQLRNTALRFRFLNILLRYNSYQTYWQRISRKIEEGTYKRDVRRANARFADGPARKKADQPIELGDDDLTELRDTEPPAARDADLDPMSAALSQRGADLEQELSLDVEVDLGTDDPFGPDSWLQQKETREVLKPAPVPKEARTVAEPAPAPRARNPLEVMPTQREIWIKPPAKPAGARATSRPPSPSRPPKRPSTAPGPRAAPPNEAAPAQPRAGIRYAQGPHGRRQSDIPIPNRAPAAQPAPARPSAAGPPPRKKSRPSMPKVEAPRTAAGRPGGRSQPPAAARPPAAKDPHLSEERVRQIYTQYVETKRSMKESTASLTYDSLAKSLRDSSDKLRTKHGGKSVDFEVAVKDGRTILRPVVK